MSAELPTISVVLPCLNEASHLEESIATIGRTLREIPVSFELVVIDDGSTDETWSLLRKLSKTVSGLRATRLSRRFGKEHALCAGLELARGSAVIVMDADLQHPPSLLPEMIAAWRDEGYDVVEATKTDRGDESFLARFEARIFYSLLRRMSGFDLAGASDFKLMDRRVIDAWTNMPERNLFFRGMSAWLGFRRKEIPFSVERRAGGRSGWSMGGLVRLAITGITAFSTVPIHLVTLTGILFLVFALVLGAQTIVNWSRGAEVGFTTVILLVLIVGSAMMIGLGIIGVYVSRIYNEVKGRPRYIVADSLESESESESAEPH